MKIVFIERKSDAYWRIVHGREIKEEFSDFCREHFISCLYGCDYVTLVFPNEDAKLMFVMRWG